ncbi:hypothetical protein B0J11DRAFT_447306, partial [Dendryphion nanum]
GIHRDADRMREEMWWKDMRIRVCFVIGVLILLVLVGIPSNLLSPIHYLSAL